MRARRQAHALTLLFFCACSGQDDQVARLDAIETWNAGLAYADDSVYYSQRRAAILDALARTSADLLCVQDVWRAADREALSEAARARLPYSVSVASALDTPVDDPSATDGSIPPAPSAPPCPPEAETLSAMNVAHVCITDHCSSTPGDDSGSIVSTRCLRQNCTPELLALLEINPRCFSCARMTSIATNISETRRICENEVDAGLAFGGDNGLLLLSRWPLEDVTLVLLPSTNFRRAILGARVDLPGGRSARVHCTALSAPVSATDLPYTGAYGGGQQGVNGWIAENELQVTKLVARVERAAAGEGAVVLGDFQTGAEYKRGADVVVAAAPAYRSIAQLEAAFAPGVAHDWRPECTHCPENPLTPGTPPYRFAQIFLRRGAPGAAIQTERTFTEGVVRGNADELIPRSFDYGLRSQLRF